MKGPTTVVSALDLNPQKWGSIEEYTLSLSQAIKARGWRSVVLFTKEATPPILDRFKGSGATLGVLPSGSSSKLHIALGSRLRQFRPAIVHFRFFNPFSAVPIAAKASGAKSVFFTEATVRPAGIAVDTKIKCQLWDRVVLQTLGIRLIAVSERVKRGLVRSYLVHPDRVRVLQNGVNTSRFIPIDAATAKVIRGELRIAPDDAVVACAAHLIPEKGISDLLAAAKQILSSRPNLTFAIAGDGPSAGIFRQEAQELGISSRVRFLGLRSDVDRFFAMADVVAVPSVCEEAAGLVLLEAMACGRPVVATRVGGIPEYVEDGKTAILVERSSPDELARALLSLLDSPSLATAMGRAGRAAAEAKFSMERWTSETLAMYDAELHRV